MGGYRTTQEEGGEVLKSIEIDRTKRLKQEPHTGHNRWHPDIPPIPRSGIR